MRALRDHVLAWLQFFAAAFADPDGETTRPDPQAYRADDDARTPQGVVRAAAASFAASIEGGVLARPGVMLSRMTMEPASAAQRLLGFAGRDPDWRPSA